MEIFPEYVYTRPGVESIYWTPEGQAYNMPLIEDSKWTYKNMANRCLDRNKVEEWKTKYYELEGWDPKTGWPTRKTLVDLGLKRAVFELKRQKKLT